MDERRGSSVLAVLDPHQRAGFEIADDEIVGLIGPNGAVQRAAFDVKQAPRSDENLLVAHGASDEVAKAREIMDTVEATLAEIHGE